MRVLSLVTTLVGVVGAASALALLTFAGGMRDQLFAGTVAAAFSGLLLVGVSRIKSKAVIAVNALACLGILYAVQALKVKAEPHRIKLLEVHRLRDQGTEAYPVVVPEEFFSGASPLLLVNGEKILPLSGLARVPTVHCREADAFLTYQSDRHGFNNPDAVWDEPVTIALLGDSYTHGSCVPPESHFAAILRRKFSVLNLGMGGNGPLSELATLREYLPRIRPKVVFWIYSDNDVVRRPGNKKPSNLQVEQTANPVLRRYLEDPAFNQNLIDLQESLAPVYRKMLDNYLRHERQEMVRLSRCWSCWGQAAQWVTLRHLMVVWAANALEFTRNAKNGGDAPSADPRPLWEIFGRVLKQAQQEVQAWGGKLVFVYIPDYGDVVGAPHQLTDSVLAAARTQGLEVIDILSVFNEVRDKNSLFAFGSGGGHYSATGYGIVGRTLLERAVEFPGMAP